MTHNNQLSYVFNNIWKHVLCLLIMGSSLFAQAQTEFNKYARVFAVINDDVAMNQNSYANDTYLGLTETQLSQQLNNDVHYSIDRRYVDNLEGTVINNTIYYSVEYKVNRLPNSLTPLASDQVIIRNVTESSFQSTYTYYKNNYGYSLHDISSFVLNGQIKYNAVLLRTADVYAEFVLTNLSISLLNTYYQRLVPQQMRINILNSQTVNNVTTYNVHFRVTNLAEIWVVGWTSTDFTNKYNELWGQGWRIATWDTNIQNGRIYYNAVWHLYNGLGEYQYYGYTAPDFTADLNATPRYAIQSLSILQVPGGTTWRESFEDDKSQAYTGHAEPTSSLTTTGNSSLTLSPNPSAGKTVVSGVQSHNSNMLLKVYDESSNLNVYNQDLGEIPMGDYEKEIDLSHLPNGHYILHIQTDDGTERKRLILVH